MTPVPSTPRSRNPLAVESGFDEDLEAPKTYLRAELGDAYDDERGIYVIHDFQEEP